MHSRITTDSLQKIFILPQNINIQVSDDNYIFEGPNGKISHLKNKNIIINKESDKKIILSINLKKKEKKCKKIALLNTTIALFKNYITGLTKLFEKTLIIKGIGYKAEHINNYIKLYIGNSHDTIINIPNNIIVKLSTPTTIIISSISKHKVGQFAHEIKIIKPADIYKGNGIKYKDEILKLKSPKKTK